MLPGLIDVEKLRCDGKKSGLESGKSGAGRGHVGGKSGCCGASKYRDSEWFWLDSG